MISKSKRIPFSMVDTLHTCFCESEDVSQFDDATRSLWLLTHRDENYTDEMKQTFNEIREQLREYYFWD